MHGYLPMQTPQSVADEQEKYGKSHDNIVM